MAFYCNQNVNETRVLASGPVYFRRVVINDLGTAGSFITVYDSSAGSGTIIAKIDPTTDAVRVYDIDTTAGLTYVTTGSPGSFTIVWA